jgi:tetratricopeptide (TPR) repeat protein
VEDFSSREFFIQGAAMRSESKTYHKKTYWALLAAVAGLPLLAGQAFGQQQVQGTGHANDANNRVGSGGYNDTTTSPQASGNQIVNREVSGGFGFQGKLPYYGPNDFHDNLPGQGVDSFIANSGGPKSSPGYLGLKGAVPVYNAAQTAAPPPGYTLGTVGGNYVPTPPEVIGPENTQLNAPLSTLVVPLPKPGELTTPGQVDPTAGTSLFSQQSQLYALTPGNMQPGQPTAAGAATLNPDQQLSQDRILEIRQQLNQNLTPQTPLNRNLAGTPAGGFNTNNGTAMGNGAAMGNGKATGNGANNTGVANPGAGNNASGNNGATNTGAGNTGAVLAQPNNLNTGPLNNQVTGATAVTPINVTPTAGDVSTDQSNRSYISLETLPAPAKQSSTYAELQRRLEAYDNSHPISDEEANREFRELVQQREALKTGTALPGALPGKPAGGLGGTTGLTGGGGAGPAAGTGVAPGNVAPPVQVGNISEGIKSKALAELLSQAEDQMQHQQFGKAMEIYTQAIQADPNNPLLLIGRANAELGGSYYRAAEADIRTAFQSDKAVMMGQYDLKKSLGDERLQYIVAQLKQIATDSKDNPTPLFLLAYVSYNTHNEPKAAEYLDEAAARTPVGTTDDVIPLLKKYWTFTPQAGGTTQPASLNK